MLLAAVPAFSRLRRVLPLLPALLLALSLSPPCGAQRASRFKSATRLVFLPSNAYSSKCLDGSPPAYYFRAGAGAGRRKWHVHLPTGGWCFSPGECRNRANSPLGSSRFWATRLPAVIENGGRINNASEEYPQLGGLLSQDSAANPVFHAWNLVWVVYCDGGAYSSTRGRADLGEGASVYMQGRQILDDIITDLRTRQGMGAASHVLFSGSSAGGHAIIMHCDRLAAAFPRASSKCFADSGFFVDAKDRFGVYSWREYIRLLTALHRIEVPKCPAGAQTRDNWVCFFPEHTLAQVSTPLFLFHSFFDWRFIQYEQQLPSEDLLYSQRCLDGQILRQRASVLARERTWGNVRWRQNFCSRQELDAVFSVGYTVYNRLAVAARRNRNLGVFLAPRSVHTTLFSVAWFLRSVNGVKLSRLFETWYGFSGRKKGMFVFE